MSAQLPSPEAEERAARALAEYDQMRRGPVPPPDVPLATPTPEAPGEVGAAWDAVEDAIHAHAAERKKLTEAGDHRTPADALIAAFDHLCTTIHAYGDHRALAARAGLRERERAFAGALHEVGRIVGAPAGSALVDHPKLVADLRERCERMERALAARAREGACSEATCAGWSAAKGLRDDLAHAVGRAERAEFEVTEYGKRVAAEARAGEGHRERAENAEESEREMAHALAAARREAEGLREELAVQQGLVKAQQAYAAASTRRALEWAAGMIEAAYPDPSERADPHALARTIRARAAEPGGREG